MSASPAPSSTGFVTVLGRISTLLAAAGLAAAVAMAGLAMAVGDATMARIASATALPPMITWALEQRRLLALLGLLLSLLFLAASWGVLRRREWARLAFIAFLAITAVLNFVTLPLVGQLFDMVREMFPQEMLGTAEGQEFLAQLRTSRFVSVATAVLTAVAFALLHAWVAWKLCVAEVRAEFRGATRHP